jgi:proteic killer suppression protein
MIKNLKHKGLAQFFSHNSKKLLNAKDMDIPGWDLDELKGERKGVWSVAVSQNWKITFRFENGEAQEVNLEDYH